MADQYLRVDFIGEVHLVDPGDQLTFGRRAQLEIDDNRHLHRLLGRFYNESNIWWLRNEGSSLPIHLVDRESRSSATISSGRSMAISFPQAAVRFSAGGLDYELLVDAHEVEPELPRVPDRDGDTTYTISASSVPLTPDQRLALVVMAEQALLHPHQRITMASNAEMARRIGWTLNRFNRKIDNLCEKFSKAGVEGLRGSVASLASDRRRRLVDHCVSTGVLLPTDLDLLREAESIAREDRA
ncbi:MAG: hypothetical protein AAGA90_01325 [Actinomycetota bacterium]